MFTISLPRVDLGDKLVVCAWAGVDEAARRDDPQNPHSGVSARLLVDNQLLAQVECRTSGWQPLSAELTSYAGKSVRMAFESDSLGNTSYDWAYIAEQWSCVSASVSLQPHAPCSHLKVSSRSGGHLAIVLSSTLLSMLL